MLPVLGFARWGRSMSFGKQGGNGNDFRNLVKPAGPAKAAKASSLDAGFIALTLGVVAVAAGGAFAAPSVMSWAGSLAPAPVRPIPDVIAGLERDAAKAALAKEAFPDNNGRAFMKAMATHFPEDHDRLLGQLADSAMKGGNRDDLVITVSQWTGGFAISHLPAIGRTGADGFDKALDMVDEALALVDEAAGGCTLEALQAVATSPEKLLAASSYGGKLYDFGMQSNLTLVDLAVAGRNAKAIDTTLLPRDEQALQSALLSMMMDEQVMSLMQAGMSGGQGAQADLAAKVDICALGHTAVVKLKTLPDDTKGRIWALGANEMQKGISRGGMGALFNPAQLSMR
jgi:hypothetical protein